MMAATECYTHGVENTFTPMRPIRLEDALLQWTVGVGGVWGVAVGFTHTRFTGRENVARITPIVTMTTAHCR
jgi:hypothetical protein